MGIVRDLTVRYYHDSLVQKCIVTRYCNLMFQNILVTMATFTQTAQFRVFSSLIGLLTNQNSSEKDLM